VRRPELRARQDPRDGFSDLIRWRTRQDSNL
jgi:hypothetical protein